MLNSVVVDRDGTLIRHIPYLCDASKVQLLPSVARGLRELVEAGLKLFLHTNQSGIGRGYFTVHDALACNDEMLRQIDLGPDLFVETKICPEKPTGVIEYRKPSPRFGLEIMARYSIQRDELCYLGDSVSDLMTATNLGCLGIGVNTGESDLPQALREQGLAFPVFDSFLEAARDIISRRDGRDETG
jgi:D-glycero-D-manno-heptose 1,7-bisphosphate phosphatase